ncbi:hypothetical protein PQX77_005994, partial [Marasmius sp. AFHP31]
MPNSDDPVFTDPDIQMEDVDAQSSGKRSGRSDTIVGSAIPDSVKRIRLRAKKVPE